MLHLKKKLFLTLLVCCTTLWLRAQHEDLPVDNFVPPSPEAAALGKYVTVPVGLYTGTPEISLPLWNVTEGSLSVPVSLSYHASGNKVDEIASRVGLGWVLNAGGVISRTVVGQPDEFGPLGYLNLTKSHTPEDMKAEGKSDSEQFDLWQRITRKCWDMEPDQFVFNFNGITGKFGFEWNSDGDNSILVACGNKVKIEPIGMPEAWPLNYIQGWKITDQDGTIYTFEAKELTRFSPVENENEDPDNVFADCYDRPATPTSWYLTHITSVDGHWIRFHYNDYTLSHWLRVSESTKVIITSDDPGRIRVKKASIQINGKSLSQITTSSAHTTIDFLETAASPRTDVPATTLGTPNNLRHLENIIVKDSKGNKVKHFVMNHTYETGRLSLKALTELSVDDQSGWKPSYFFDYDATPMPPFPSKIVTLPGTSVPLDIGSIVGIYTQDHWGFYNSNTMQTLLPAENNRSPDPVRMKAGLLTKIYYPTGGTTTFEYEPHTYSAIGEKYLGEERTAGGVRIKKITDHDGRGTPMVRTFEYKLDNGLSSGAIANLPSYKFFSFMVIGSQAVVVPLYASNSLVPLVMTKGSYISYREVTVYDGQNMEGGKSKSYFTSFFSHNDNYSGVPYSAEHDAYFQPHPPAESWEVARGLLTKQVDFKYEGGIWTAVKESEFEYDLNSTAVKGFKAGERLPGMFSADDMNGNTAEALMGIAFYNYRFGFPKMTRSKETVIENNQRFTTEKTFAYNTSTLTNATEKFNLSKRFLVRETSKTSANTLLVTEYSYPFDYGDYFPFHQMKQRHILSPVIEKVVKEVHPDFPESTMGVIGGSYVAYQSFANRIYPGYVYKLSAQYPVHDLLRSKDNSLGRPDERYYTPTAYYVSYSPMGKPLEVRQTTDLNAVTDDEITSYIYDKSNAHLIAKVTNGTSSYSAFTDFENGINEGGWNFSDHLPNFSSDAHTGSFSFSGELNTFISGDNAYVVSLWAKGSGTVTVNNETKQVRADWQRYEWTINYAGPPIMMLVVNTNGNLIDGLRVHTSTARMVTYTHKPHIGITSMTDENHVTSYYDYDGFGRLTTVRDEDRNIVTHHQYNYR